MSAGDDELPPADAGQPTQARGSRSRARDGGRVKPGDAHTSEARQRMSRSMTALADLRDDELRQLHELGSATTQAYADNVGCAPNTARARLNRLVDEGRVRRFRVAGAGRGGVDGFEALP